MSLQVISVVNMKRSRIYFANFHALPPIPRNTGEIVVSFKKIANIPFIPIAHQNSTSIPTLLTRPHPATR
jgi:hypothetical protein